MIKITLIHNLHELLWGLPLVSFILFTSLYLTIKLKGLQFRKLKKALLVATNNKKTKTANLTNFQTLCLLISSTLGAGNITGVAVAISLGGAGALFWMIVSVFLGMILKYRESYLAHQKRLFQDDMIIGGPYVYINNKKLAKVFAVGTMLSALLGMGTMIQSSGIMIGVKTIFKEENSIIFLLTGMFLAFLCGLVLIGGIKRIGRFCELIVPFMAIIYLMMCLIVIILNFNNLPNTIFLIIKEAFNFKPLLAGVTGYNILTALKEGTTKGIFASEAGLGSAPLASTEADFNNPNEAGLAAIASTFLGSVIVCTLTGLVIIITKSYLLDLEGVKISEEAFLRGLPFPKIITSILLLICLFCFGFTTMIGWNLYGTKCLMFLTNNKKVIKIYNWLYILMIFNGCLFKPKFIWEITELCNIMMIIPNIISLIKKE